MCIVAPSILAADFARLGEELEMINQSEAEWLHIDVMDGRFVPNISFGFPVMAAIKKHCSKFLDVHLMIEQPDDYVEQFRAAGAEMITVHVEACKHLHRTIQHIKSTGAKAGVALNPHTPISAVLEVLEDLDLVLIMSVNPGFGGQKFIYNSIQKIKTLKEEIITRNLPTLIEVDGGVGLQNAEVLIHAGADVLVAGSSVFNSPEPKDSIKRLRMAATERDF